MDEFSTTRPPKTTQGIYGTIDEFGGGAKTYSDPRDNPNYQANVPTDTAGNTPTTSTSTSKESKSKRYTRTSLINKDTSDYSIEPKSAEDIQADMTMAAQGEINALNDYYKSMLAEQATINQKNERSTAAISTLTGLAGSTEADIQQQKTTAAGQKANQAIIRENMLQVQSVLGKIRTSAVEEARSQRLEARQSEQDRIALRKAKKEEMDDNIKTLAAAGVTLDGLRTGDKQTYDYLVKEYGSEDILKGAFVLNTPQDQIIDKKLQGGKYMIARQNPTTGKISIETMETGLPPEYNDITKIGGKYVAVPTGWDGDMTKLRTVGYEPTEESISGYTENQLKVITKINQDVSKNATYAKTTSMRGFADNVVASLQMGNGVGDIAAINQFQKVIDEGAVTRDQDVKLISSAQSLVNSLKTKIKKLEKGDQLSPEQRTQMRTLVEDLYKSQIKALEKDPYVTAKTREAGFYGIKPTDTILGDLGAFSSDNQSSKILTNPNTGEQFDASDLTEEEYNQALQDGYVAQ